MRYTSCNWINGGLDFRPDSIVLCCFSWLQGYEEFVLVENYQGGKIDWVKLFDKSGQAADFCKNCIYQEERDWLDDDSINCLLLNHWTNCNSSCIYCDFGKEHEFFNQQQPYDILPILKDMKENGIRPFITLFHWEFPYELFKKGGWLNDEVVQWFGEYAKVVAENFSDLCSDFITINEPQCAIGLGHLSGVHAPGMKYSIPETFQMAHNLMKAHGQAVINLRKYAKQKIRVGYAPTCGVAYPATESADDIAAAKKVYFGFENPMDNWTWNVAWFSDPVFLGEYPKEGLEKFADYLPEITEEDMQLIHQPLDFVGQNIYNGYMIRCGADGDPEYVDRAPGTAKTGTGWPVTPEALYYGIRFLTERYRLPLYITENGMSDLDNISADGQVHDRERITFLDAYLGAVQRAINEGMPVIGYFLWTFLDNFEWAEGYKERFGLVYVDYTTQRRIAKDSAYWYREVMRMNGENLSCNQPYKQILFMEPEMRTYTKKGSYCMPIV